MAQCYVAVVLNLFDMGPRWTLPGLAAACIWLVVPIRHLGQVQQGWPHGGRQGATQPQLGPMDKGDMVWPHSSCMGVSGHDLPHPSPAGQEVGLIQPQGLGFVNLAAGKVAMLITTALLLPNIPTHGETHRLDAMDL